MTGFFEIVLPVFSIAGVVLVWDRMNTLILLKEGERKESVPPAVPFPIEKRYPNLRKDIKNYVDMVRREGKDRFNPTKALADMGYIPKKEYSRASEIMKELGLARVQTTKTGMDDGKQKTMWLLPEFSSKNKDNLYKDLQLFVKRRRASGENKKFRLSAALSETGYFPYGKYRWRARKFLQELGCVPCKKNANSKKKTLWSVNA